MASTNFSGWIRWQRGAASILISPIVLGLVLLFALIEVPQFREIYLAAAEPGRGWQFTLGLCAMVFLSASLFFGYLWQWVVMRSTGIGFGSRLVYPDPILIKDDRRIVALRDCLATACAAVPFLGLFFGHRATAHETAERIQMIEAAGDQLGVKAPLLTPDLSDIAATLTSRAWLILLVMLLMLLAFNIGGRLDLADVWKARRRRLLAWIGLAPRLPIAALANPPARSWVPFRRRLRMRTRMPWTVWGLFGLMLLAPLLAQSQALGQFNFAVVRLGPFAILGLALMTLATLLFFLGNLSRLSGVPIMLLIVLIVLFWGTGRYLGQDKTPGSASAGAAAQTTRSPGSSALTPTFRRWLETRADRDAFKGRKYPVFVVAAQGGGIYAAASAADFLGKLQDGCSNFSQHVFAISSVSGGSLGSALFNSIADPDQSSARCAPGGRTGDSHVVRAARVTRADHLSATMAAAVPDVLNNVVRLVWHETVAWFGVELDPQTPERGRARALECSFLQSYYGSLTPRPPVLSTICAEGAPRPGNGLGAAFGKPWPPADRKAAPALVLNTTRSETGDRVAYAPFDLKRVGDGTLRSFAELEDANVDVTLIEAAVTSARFPGMMPAKIVPYASKGAARGNGKWRNFVDGGYADSSGATTALEIYHDLMNIVKDPKSPWAHDVDLRLVLLTDAPGINGGEPRGDGLVHAISPLITLFSVRGQMARRAVKRAEEDVHTLTGTERKPVSCTDHEWKVRLVMLDQQTFNLPLGWMVSTPTSLLIGRMIGEPRRLEKPASPLAENEPDAIKRAANILYNNSCTMFSMTELLAGKTDPFTPARP